ncbi:MAG: hypothetical protein FWC89_07340 [Defluviitaleaceae bacterium]|nr:hypothetical protein [Defluviitaleaceae bacterium]
MNIFDEALKSLQEAIDYEKGDASKGRIILKEIKVADSFEYVSEDTKIAQ